MSTAVITKPLAFRELLKFALPIILGQVGIMLIGTGDMIIAGRYSRECLAAIGLAISIANPIQISLLGFQFSTSPLLAQKRGAGESIVPYFWTTQLYSFFIATVSCVLTLLSSKIVPFFNYGPVLTPIIQDYLIVTSFSSYGLCLYQGMKEFFQSEEKTFAANFVALVAVGVNLILNYALVFGAYGLPALHEIGLAYASLTVRTFMGVALFMMAWKWFKTPKHIDWDFMKKLAKIGGPISFTLFLEIMAFCSVTLFVGKFAEIQTAANNLALNVGSLAFMIPLSISAAVSVKVGHALGERNFNRISIFSNVSIITSFTFTILTGAFFYFYPETVLSLYTEDTLVLEWATKLLFFVACFQLFDGVQVTMAGILRGLSITKAPSVAIFIGYWVFGIPIGYYLAFHQGQEAVGFWVGLAISLAIVAVILGVMLNKHLKALKGNLQGSLNS